jgi:hypothetical protein
MKNVIIVLVLMALQPVYSQSEYSVYVPMRTYHWNREPLVLNSFHNTEGGNLGAVLIRRNEIKQNLYSEQHLGAIRNSYGDFCIIAHQAIVISYKRLEMSLAVGLATGYHKLYENGNLQTFPDVFKSNGIIPSGMISLRYNKYKISPIINISPTFINGGLAYKIN